MKNKYFAISEKSTAIALNYLGFKYLQFTDKNDKIIYSFKNSEEFHSARTELWKLRIKYRKV